MRKQFDDQQADLAKTAGKSEKQSQICQMLEFKRLKLVDQISDQLQHIA